LPFVSVANRSPPSKRLVGILDSVRGKNASGQKKSREGLPSRVDTVKILD
jgi:hypothetical protein